MSPVGVKNNDKQQNLLKPNQNTNLKSSKTQQTIKTTKNIPKLQKLCLIHFNKSPYKTIALKKLMKIPKSKIAQQIYRSRYGREYVKVFNMDINTTSQMMSGLLCCYQISRKMFYFGFYACPISENVERCTDWKMKMTYTEIFQMTGDDFKSKLTNMQNGTSGSDKYQMSKNSGDDFDKEAFRRLKKWITKFII